MHDANETYCRMRRELSGDWSQERHIVDVYHSLQTSAPAYDYWNTPTWIRQGIAVIHQVNAVDADRRAAQQLAEHARKSLG